MVYKRLTCVFSFCNRIVALTVGRIYYDEKIDFDDLAYTAAPAIMFTVPEPSLGIVAGCVPITVPVFTRASKSIKSTFASSKTVSRGSTLTPHGSSRRSTQRKRSIPLSSGFGGKGDRRAGDDVYAMTSVVVSRCSRDDAWEDGYPTRGSPEQLRATEDLMRRCGVARQGITVLSEVSIESQERPKGKSKGDWA